MAVVGIRSSSAEEAVLGSLLLDPQAWPKVAPPVLHSDDFSRPDHRLIFQAIAALAADCRPADPVTVSEQLERIHELEAAGGLAYLSKLRRETPTAENVLIYANSMRERAVRRRLDELLSDSPEGPELAERLEREIARLRSAQTEAVTPLAVESVSQWTGRPAPAPRDWIIEGLVPARRLTSFLADGGLGKTTVALQIGVHVATGRALYGLAVSGGPVLGIFCEDEPEELQRRVSAACAAEQLELANLDNLVILSRDGEDNVLCTFESDRMALTGFYRQLDATVAALRPRLLILDTLADVFGGKYLETTHVRQFTKTALGGLCKRHGCAVLLVAHPSSSGIESGEGAGFSTAWNNSVRSRLYLRRPRSEDQAARQDRRVLELKKANYGPSGTSVALLWHAGAFIPDPDPIDEATVKAPRVDTGLALAIAEYFRTVQKDGSVVRFDTVRAAMDAARALPTGTADAVRKAVSRTLGELVKAGTLTLSKAPRGYRLAAASLGTNLGQTRDSRDSGHRDTRDTPSGYGVSCPEMSHSMSRGACPEDQAETRASVSRVGDADG